MFYKIIISLFLLILLTACSGKTCYKNIHQDRNNPQTLQADHKMCDYLAEKAKQGIKVDYYIKNPQTFTTTGSIDVYNSLGDHIGTGSYTSTTTEEVTPLDAAYGVMALLNRADQIATYKKTYNECMSYRGWVEDKENPNRASNTNNKIILYALEQPTVRPKRNAPTVTVVEFKDSRDDTSVIGTRKGLSAFTTDESPTLWVSHALADVMAQHGLAVSYAKTFEQARRGNPDYIVTGKLQRLWLKEISDTYIEVIIEAQFTLANRERHLLRENIKSYQNRNEPSSKSQIEVMLKNTLHDLVDPTANICANTILSKKK